jgi:ureidoglycolate lyase
MGDPRLLVQELTSDAFTAYGSVIQTPTSPQDADGPGWRWWAEIRQLESDDRRWTVGYLDLEPVPLARFDWAERHMRTQEAIVPVSGSCLVYVAPAEHPDEPDRLPPFEDFRVFRLPPGTGVVMDRAVWHGAPLADGGAAKAIVLLLEGTGRDDVTIVRFPDAPVLIEEA